MPADIRTTYSLGAVFPTGRSPYKINSSTELSTGNGLYQLSFSTSFSKQVDPLVFFWSLGYSYPFDFNLQDLSTTQLSTYTLNKVDPGSTINASLGWGYALSYANSLNMSVNYQYAFSSTLKYAEITKNIETGDQVSATFNLGMGFMVTPKTVMSASLGYSLTSTAFSLNVRVPFDFMI
jgi:outer membrane protein W